jgi:dihydrofolate synthase/folylpolyglutamate synthase
MLAERGAPIDDDGISRGIASTVWPGRLERIATQPDIYLDGAHNPSGAREIAVFWETHLPGRKIVLVYGALRDKAVDEIAGLLFPHASTVILTAPAQSRAISAPVLGEMTRHHARQVEIIPDPNLAFESALSLASPDDVIFVTGSLYLVGDLRRYWMSRAAGRSGVSRA